MGLPTSASVYICVVMKISFMAQRKLAVFANFMPRARADARSLDEAFVEWFKLQARSLRRRSPQDRKWPRRRFGREPPHGRGGP